MLGDVDESVNFVVICEFLLLLPFSYCLEAICMGFSSLNCYKIFPDPTYVIGQFCARVKVCDVSSCAVHAFAYFTVVQEALLYTTRCHLSMTIPIANNGSLKIMNNE